MSTAIQAPEGQYDLSKQATNEDIHHVATPDSSSNLDSENEKSCAQSRKQVSVWMIAGSAFANLSDGYQQNLASSTNTRISNALLVGSVIGILVFGYSSDRFSRKGGMLVTSALVIIGLLMATLAFQVNPADNILWYLTIAGGAAGVGVGGGYPNSAAAALEGSNEHFDGGRGPIQVLISTLMATSGGPICTFVYLATLLVTSNNLTNAYRAMYSISIFLPLLVVIIRWKMQDGKLFQCKILASHTGDEQRLLLYNFVNFPNSIMSSVIINSLLPGKNLRNVALWQLYLALMPVPGVLIGALLMNRIGRRWTGILGFAGESVVLGFIIGGCYDKLTKNSIAAFVVLYGVLQALGHMGPGASIGLICVEAYPTAVRGMGYGIAAGFGKAGAAVGTQVFTPIRAAAGPASTFYVAGGICVLGCAIYYFLPEGRCLDLQKEDAEFEACLQAYGYIAEEKPKLTA